MSAPAPAWPTTARKFRVGVRENPLQRSLAVKVLHAKESGLLRFTLDWNESVAQAVEGVKALFPELRVESPANDRRATRTLALSNERSALAPEIVECLDTIYEFTRRGAEEALLDFIYDRLDNLLLAGDFDTCDAILTEVNVARLDSVGMIGFLTITLPARQRLDAREGLVTRIRDALLQKRPGHEVDGLLQGLG